MQSAPSGWAQDFEIPTDYLILAWRKKTRKRSTFYIVGFAIPADHKVREREKINNTWILPENWRNCCNLQIPMTLQGIFADLINAVVRRVSILPLISNSWCANYKWYHSHLHIQQHFQLSGNIKAFVYFVTFFYFPIYCLLERLKSTWWQVLFF